MIGVFVGAMLGLAAGAGSCKIWQPRSFLCSALQAPALLLAAAHVARGSMPRLSRFHPRCPAARSSHQLAAHLPASARVPLTSPPSHTAGANGHLFNNPFYLSGMTVLLVAAFSLLAPVPDFRYMLTMVSCECQGSIFLFCFVVCFRFATCCCCSRLCRSTGARPRLAPQQSADCRQSPVAHTL